MDAATERLMAAAAPVPGRASPCCGESTRPPTLSDYIDRGLRRRGATPLPIVGDGQRDDGGRFARFSVRLTHGVISDVAFEATTCVTLVAYCELAAQLVTGLTVPAAARVIRVERLEAELPLVPAGKRERARLTAQALLAAVVESSRRSSE